MMLTSKYQAGREPRPLIWWSSSQCEAMASRLAEGWTRWRRDWASLPQGRGAVTCQLVWESDASASDGWQLLGARDDAQAWVRTDALPADVASAVLFGDDAVDILRARPGTAPLAASVCSTAAADCVSALLDALGLQPCMPGSSPEAELFQPWSGAVLVSLAAGASSSLRLLLTSSCAAQLAAAVSAATHARAVRRGGLIPVEAACADRQVMVRASLCGCELDLGMLAGLRVGDVIPLPHPLEAPLHLTLAGETVSAGFLGRQGRAKAIELTIQKTAADAAPADTARGIATP